MTKAVKIESPKINKTFSGVWTNPNYSQACAPMAQAPQGLAVVPEVSYLGNAPQFQAVAPIFSGQFGLNAPVSGQIGYGLFGTPQGYLPNGLQAQSPFGINSVEAAQIAQLAQNGFLGAQQIPLGGRAPLSLGARTALSQGNVTYYDADHETIIECKFPGINPKNLALTIVGDTLRIRQKTTVTSKSKSKTVATKSVGGKILGKSTSKPTTTKKTTESCEFLALPIPPLTEISQIKALAEKGALKIILPRIKEVRQNIREVRIA